MDGTTPLLLGAVLATSVLSGVLGMGGGMILMGVYGWVLPVPEAMALHGVTQLGANGFRAGLLRGQIRGRVLFPYLVGACLALLIFAGIRFVPSKALVFVALGVLPFLTPILPEAWTIDEARPGSAAGCGLAVGALHMVAGVSGSVLDVFFLRAPLDRREVVATKAATQTLAHGFKLIYYALLAAGAGAAVLTAPVVLGVWVAAATGTWLGRQLLERISEDAFRGAGGVVVRGAGIVYLVRGLTAF